MYDSVHITTLDFQKRKFLCKYFVVQYRVGLPGAFLQYFCIFADQLGCTEVVQAYEPPRFSH